MKKVILSRTLMAICLAAILFFGEYSNRQQRDNLLKRAAEQRSRKNEKQEEDYTTLTEPEEIELYSDEFRTFSYNKSIFYLDFQEEKSGYITISIRALELPRTPDDEESTVFLIGTTANTDEHEKYTEVSSRIKFQESFTQKLCNKIFNAEEDKEVVDDGYSYLDNDLVEYYMELSDGSVCYTKIVYFEDVITYVLLREAEYSHVLNPYYHEIYDTVSAVSME